MIFKKITKQQILSSIKEENTKIITFVYNKYQKQFSKFLKKVSPQIDKTESLEIYHESLMIFIEQVQNHKKITSSIVTYLNAIGKNIVIYRCLCSKKVKQEVNLLYYHPISNDMIQSENEDEVIQIFYDILDEAITLLSPKGKEIMEQYLYEQKGVKELAKIHGYTNVKAFSRKKYKHKIKLQEIILRLYEGKEI